MLKRIILKLSGELFPGVKSNVSKSTLYSIASDIYALAKQGLEIAVVIGGGNIIRGGKYYFNHNIDRLTADHMGMFATMINALALQSIFSKINLSSVILSSRSVDGVFSISNPIRALDILRRKKIVIFAGGTSNPFVSTDSAASLRACEINAGAILKATTVDGIYNKDPNKFDKAKMFDVLSFNEMLNKELLVMDLFACVQCRDFNIPICVFNMNRKRALIRIVNGAKEGTWVTSEERNYL
jgi:uridylate kinase